ncbi:MAG: hypothetical protein B6U78_02905 [Candidatus Aenigmarchaeota archaeon ex4484_224]|nr:MAG: hypothetical protein B6U78_02905 [Candidatus Aenigmarchaeota archaeon ex4484_224]
MKLCFISSFPPSKGNLAEYGFYLIKEFKKSKLFDSIVVLANQSNSKKEERIGKLKIIRCWKQDDFFLPFRILYRIWKENPDIVHFNLHMMNWGKSKVVNFLGAVTPLLTKILLRKKVVITLHNIVEAVDLEKMNLKKNFLIEIGTYLATKSLLSVDKVIVTLDFFKRILVKKYKAKNIVTIFHGTFGKKVKRINLNSNKILAFGFWREIKNLPLLIEAFSDLKKKYKNLELIVAGSSHPYFPNYLEEIKKKYKKVKGIKYLGYVPEKKLDKVFKSSFLIVLPYLTGVGTSGVVHLGVSYGKPIIASDIPQIVETTKEEKFKVIFFKNNDKEDLKKQIEWILKNRKKVRKIVEENLKISAKNSFSQISKKYLSLFKSLIS